MKKTYIYLSILTFVAAGCSKNKGGFQGANSLPATYDFENVNYSGQTTRVTMLEEMSAYMKTGNTTGVVLDANVLKNMFSNTGSPFADTALNTSGKQLKNKCFILDQPVFEAYMDSIALASSSLVGGSNGTAGVVVSTTDPSKKYLFGANGFEYAQIIDKGIMSAVFYYQASETYLSESGIGMTVDNVTVVPGEGTAMQHHWDEAFGYFTAPIDFPATLTGLKYWAKYSNTVDPSLGCNDIMMDEFKRGRIAINNNDHTTKDNSALLVKATWDKIIAATAIHYLNEALSNFSDDALRNHNLSECVAFVNGLKYNATRLITLTEIDSVLAYIGSNLYLVSSGDLNLAKDLLSSIYDLDDVKDAL
jgi:Domain of unknown function (DUF4856)